MPSKGKKKTTMAKLTRESRLRERRAEKTARKNARKAAALLPDPVSETDSEDSPAGANALAGDSSTADPVHDQSL